MALQELKAMKMSRWKTCRLPNKAPQTAMLSPQILQTYTENKINLQRSEMYKYICVITLLRLTHIDNLEII